MILSLNKVQLDTPLNQPGQCLLLAELILPRNAIARKAALKDIRLSARSSGPASVAKADFARAPFYEKALLKEKVDGPFGLKLSLTRPLKRPEWHKFLRRLLATGIESSTDLLSSFAISHSLVADVLEEAGDSLADQIADASPAFIATGGLDLDSASLTTGPVTVPLKLTEALRKSDLPPGPKSREKRKTRAKNHRKGSPVGQVQCSIDADQP